MTGTLLTSVALGLIAGAPALKDKPTSLPDLIGEWVVEAYLLGGKEAPPGVRVRFAAEGTAVFSGGKAVAARQGTYTTDRTKTPAEIDIHFNASGVEPMIGIFKADGDALVLCFGPKGGRPGKFDSPAGSPAGLLTLKRVKAKD